MRPRQPESLLRASERAHRRHAPRPTRDQVIVGGSIAALVTADALGACGHPVRLMLPERGVGGGFATVRHDGRTLELGARLLELGFEGADTAPPLADYRPGIGAHRAWAPVVERWARDLLGNDIRPIGPPVMIHAGRRVPDVLFTVDLGALPTWLPRALRARMLEEADHAQRTLGDAGLLHPDHAVALHTASLHDASTAQHGPTFHRELIAPIVEKVLPGGCTDVAATLRRKVWAPLFHPRTLREALAGDPVAFRPARRFDTVDDPAGCGAIVQRLLARIRGHESVVVGTVGRLRRLDEDATGDVLLTFADGPSVRATRPLLAGDPYELFAASGVAYEVPRVRTVICWLETNAEGAQDVPDLTHVLDPDNPIFRVSRGGDAGTPGRALLTVELRHDTPSDEIHTAAARGLRDARLVGPRTELTAVTAASRRTFPVPTHAVRDAHAHAMAQLRAREIDIHLAAGALSPVADTLNDQVVQGLRTAEEIL